MKEVYVKHKEENNVWKVIGRVDDLLKCKVVDGYRFEGSREEYFRLDEVDFLVEFDFEKRTVKIGDVEVDVGDFEDIVYIFNEEWPEWR